MADPMDRFIDYIKHLTTLSTGSILILAGLLEKVFTTPKWRLLVVVSIVGFASTVMASLMVYTSVIKIERIIRREWDMGTEVLRPFAVLTVAQVSFAVAILCFAVFTVRNLF